MFGGGDAPPPEQEQMTEDMLPQEVEHAGHELAWYQHPGIIGPIAGAIIVSIVGPLIVMKVKERSASKSKPKKK